MFGLFRVLQLGGLYANYQRINQDVPDIAEAVLKS